MATLRWPDGRGRFVDRDADRCPGDAPLTVRSGETVDVDDSDVVEHYLDRGFERVDDGADDADSDDTADADTVDDSDAEQSADDGEVDLPDPEEFDVGAFLDRTPVSDVVDDIEAGKADGYLDAVDAEASRVTVTQAVDDRKDAIGGD